jgi:hypothetical protein
VESPGDARRELLRHAVATLAYRGAKALRGAPEGFGAYRVGAATRTPAQVLAHVGDLLDWALALARGQSVWHDSAPLPWEEEVARCFEAVRRLDAYLASDAPLGWPAAKLFQGPVADALTHVGQIAMLRRLAGSPVKGENYLKADIVAGRVGPDQTPAKREFD